MREPANTTLGEICKIIDCEHKTAPTQPEGIPLIRTPNIGQGRLDLEDVQRVSEKTYSEWTRRAEPKSGDLIMAREAPVGNVALIPDGLTVCLGQRTVLIRITDSEVEPGYLTYLLNSPAMQAYLQLLSNGATVGHLNVTDIRKLALPELPERDVQRRVAAVLSAYDDLIENNTRRIALLEHMAEHLYREWFVRMRFPGHKQATFVKGVPEEWRVVKLGDIASFTMGQSPKSEYYNEEGDGLPFHQGVGTYGIRFPQTERYCSVVGRKARKGDILFSVRAPVGRLNMADREMIIGRGLAAVRHKKGYTSYLLYMLKVAFAREDIIGNGAIFNSVGKKELSNFGVYEPPEGIVRRFDEVASNIDQEIATLTQSVETLTKTRNLLLPRLISGKLSVEALIFVSRRACATMTPSPVLKQEAMSAKESCSMPSFISEDDLERALLRKLEEDYGYETLNAYTEDPADLNDGTNRTDKRDVILKDRLLAAALRINPDLPHEAVATAL